MAKIEGSRPRTHYIVPTSFVTREEVEDIIKKYIDIERNSHTLADEVSKLKTQEQIAVLKEEIRYHSEEHVRLNMELAKHENNRNTLDGSFYGFDDDGNYKGDF